MTARREATQQPDGAMRRRGSGAVRGQQVDESAVRREDETAAQDDMATEGTRDNQLAHREDERAAQCRQRQRRRRDDVDGDAEAVEDEDYPDKEEGEEEEQYDGGEDGGGRLQPSSSPPPRSPRA